MKLTTEGDEQLYGRYYTAVAARAAGCVAIDCPFVDFQEHGGLREERAPGPADGLRGQDADPSEPDRTLQQALCARLPRMSSGRTGVVKIFEEEGIAKGKAAVSYKGKMVDTPVYDNARTILSRLWRRSRPLTRSGRAKTFLTTEAVGIVLAWGAPPLFFLVPNEE